MGAPQSADSQPLPALEELVQTIARHGYQESVVHRLVALAQGQGPERQIAWERLPEDKLREITGLLELRSTADGDARPQQRQPEHPRRSLCDVRQPPHQRGARPPRRGGARCGIAHSVCQADTACEAFGARPRQQHHTYHPGGR